MDATAPDVPMSTSRRDVGLTFAGGGNRAFYQLGLLREWWTLLEPRIAAIGACSAGASVATLWLSGRESLACAFWERRRRGVTRNLDWANLLRGRNPAPHGPIYRDTLLCAYAEGGLERIRAQPFPVYVQTAAFPRGWPAGLGVLVGMGAYNLEKRLRPGMLHPTLGRRIGFRSLVVDARECTTPEELAALVIASSATPPFTPVGSFRGQSLLDGGMIDNIPADATEANAAVRANVVLLTRSYPDAVIGVQGRRVYVAPSSPVPVHRWDYTRPDLVEATIALGESDASHHRSLLLGALAQARAQAG